MERRIALKLLTSSGLGYGLLTSFRPIYSPSGINNEWHELLESFSQHILGDYYNNPQADLSKGVFIQCYISQCWTKENQDLFWQTATAFQHYCNKVYNKNFENLSGKDQESVLMDTFNPKKNLFEGDTEWAILIRQMVLFDFFSSQKGATEVLRHLPLPGRDEGQIPLQAEDTLFRH